MNQVAKNSLDDCLWALIKQKIALLGEMVRLISYLQSVFKHRSGHNAQLFAARYLVLAYQMLDDYRETCSTCVSCFVHTYASMHIPAAGAVG